MKYAEVAENVKKLLESPPAKDEFIVELLLAYGTPKATISRLKSGAINLSKEPGEVLLKKKVYYKFVSTNLIASMDTLARSKKIKTNDPRFLKQTITMHVGEVLTERENHSGNTMLHDPDKVPDGLREAHHNRDLAVDRLYRSKPFTSDEERLEHLFKLYEEMTGKEELV